MTTLYRTDTTLQDILNMRVGDELRLSGDDIPDYTESDAGKTLKVNQTGTGLEWGSELPSYTSSDVGKVLTVGERIETVVVVPEQTVTTDENGEATLIGIDFSRLTDGDKVSTTIAGLGTQDTEYYSSGTEGEGLYSNGHLLLSATTLFGPPSTTVTLSATVEITGHDVAPVWETIHKPEYDAVLQLTYDEQTSSYVADKTFEEESALGRGVTLVKFMQDSAPDYNVVCNRELTVTMPGNVVTDVIYTSKDIVLQLDGNAVKFEYTNIDYKSTGITDNTETKYIALSTN